MGQDPFPGDNATQPGPGRVVFSQPNSTTTRAEVVLAGASPNTDYPVRLIQGNGADCTTVDATIHTDGSGAGIARIVEARAAGSSTAQVIVDTSAEFVTPSYRASNKYTLH